MASLEESAHKKISAALADSRISPAVLARLLQGESTYVNESFMQYFYNYIVQIAHARVIPFHLAEVQQECIALYNSLTELGLTGDTVGRVPTVNTEYLTV